MKEKVVALALGAISLPLPAATLPPAVAAHLPQIAFQAAEWAEARARESLAAGHRLTPPQLALARSVGVRDPQRIRLRVVDSLPALPGPVLVAAAAQIGLAPERASAITLGHAIVVVRGAEEDMRLLSHEMRHVAQYEQAGGIRAFLAIHVPQLVEFGYERSPFEVDARAHERER
jgi:hypothetical protein